MSNSMPVRMPVIFFGHGNPMYAIEDNRYTEAWQQLGATFPRPKAILVISAHWYTRGTAVTAMTNPKTIHDFGGFPQALFDVQYPAVGDPRLAARVQELLAPVAVHMDQSWGLDHGTWAVLRKVYPEANVPVIQLSMDATQPAEFHYALGGKLATLREEGYLIIGSGNVVHNLRRMVWGDAPAFDWATRFNDKVRGHVLRCEFDQLVAYEQGGHDAKLSAPTAEHFLPLLYVIGAGQTDESARIVVDGIENGAISMLTTIIGG